MKEFLVPVRNEFTGEIRVVQVICEHVVDAQVEALQRLFHAEGWRKATAMLPEPGT